ncbi:cupin domain-containing protein [Streptomyces palmae]|uniref:JmjC domain-containing protein n=1 Tax=Streptomyces palmae TaxID=1701085 RepID=A0A4Z0H9Z9_9ACTN|nr:cupin domain-containing protein [Streptomyces palmae]TGB10116.1 hypothetical protein E4099_13065 [Streptomyces palmae]
MRDNRLLGTLTVPVPQQDFLDRYWGQRPLHIPRDDPGHFSDLLTLDDFDTVLALSGPDYAQFGVIEGRRMDPVGEGGTLDGVYEAFRAGASLRVAHTEARWEPLQRLTEELGAALGARVWVNSYLTPAGDRQAFPPHCDREDVFIAQIHGAKRWRLYGTRQHLPLQGRMYQERTKDAAKYEQEIVLRQGDTLYLPRGVIHAASSLDTVSLHCTVTVEQLLWSAVISEAMEQVFEEDVDFRKELPPGFADDPAALEEVARTLRSLLDTLHERLSPRAIAQQAASRARKLQPVAPRGRLVELAARDVRDDRLDP